MPSSKPSHHLSSIGEVGLLALVVFGFYTQKMDINRSVIRSEVRQALEEYLQSSSSSSPSADARETPRMEGNLRMESHVYIIQFSTSLQQAYPEYVTGSNSSFYHSQLPQKTIGG